ncbi:hypothetical protein [Thermococcus nautili]|uniref:Uncharacterized protein n=1 Tax=Thermococcus nautili TaxID=195522 RepID=W8NWN0_9EURY|nr:hypothetical protein [Thermococcus nautili]AHL23698.1 hypothetical protein BD01_2102 [Thermococcus nautili]
MAELLFCPQCSCNVGPRDPDKDLKVYVKYESILEKAGIGGEIIGMKTIEGVSDVTVKDGTTAFSIAKPKSLKVAQVRLENGTVINVTLVNTYGAKLTSPGNDVVAMASSPSSAEILSNEIIGNDVTTLKGDVRVVTSSGEMPLESGLVVSYSSADDTPDGEIWFVVTTNDADGIPFYREIELNRELEANGFTVRFDPTDKNNADLNGDYDGDGVPNAVELLIGKDPAKRDILGIELNVSVEWKMSEEDKKNLIYSIRKASDFIYDYTDGYAMITRVTIWDDKRNWDMADVRVHYTHPLLPQTPAQVFYDGWPQAIVGGYWMKRSKNVTLKEKGYIHIMMSKEFERFSYPGGTASIGSVRWGRTLAHELGHYVFWFGDEYEDWKHNTYLWGYMTCDDFACYPNWELYNMAPHSVMKHEWSWSELSTPKDYERFHEYLSEKFGDWKDHTTDQWGDSKDSDGWHSSAWETLYKILTSKNLRIKACVPLEDPSTSKGSYSCKKVPIIISNKIEVLFAPNYSFIPKTGPYTGVSYFMEVIWG